jgi:hypothetical protein
MKNRNLFWLLTSICLSPLVFSESKASFEPMLDQYKQKLFPLLKRMCAVSPIYRIDCVQALYYLDPTHFIIKKYAAAWMAKVGNGNI